MKRLNPSPRGFSLVELLVVLSIIVLLMGLGTVAMSQVKKAQIVHRSREIVKDCAQALSELKVVADKVGDSTVLNFTDIDGSTGGPNGGFLTQVAKYPSALKMLDLIPKDNIVRDGTGKITQIKDGWDTPIGYVAPGAVPAGAGGYTFPKRTETGFFYSCGPNKTIVAATTATDDNVYSFDQD